MPIYNINLIEDRSKDPELRTFRLQIRCDCLDCQNGRVHEIGPIKVSGDDVFLFLVNPWSVTLL